MTRHIPEKLTRMNDNIITNLLTFFFLAVLWDFM